MGAFGGINHSDRGRYQAHSLTLDSQYLGAAEAVGDRTRRAKMASEIIKRQR